MTNQIHHADAIEYNETLAAAAEKLSRDLKDPEVKRWCASIGKQHRYYARKHKLALSRLSRKRPESAASKSKSRWEEGIEALEEFELQQKVSENLIVDDPEPIRSGNLNDEQAEYAAAFEAKQAERNEEATA